MMSSFLKLLDALTATLLEQKKFTEGIVGPNKKKVWEGALASQMLELNPV
jgi:hypothetical protein